MSHSTARRGSLRASVRGFVAVATIASIFAGITFSPVFADNHGHRGGDRGHWHGDRGHWRGGRDWRGGPVYEPYPVYAPPPVYYPPEPSPGINLFFPIRIR
ncbi:MAG: hypothetical protein P4L83_12735 [Nevskia sp.]|nr:hypothetical protein [Nevskia sp.]